MIKDILLPLVSYPLPTPAAAMRSAVDLASHYGAHLTAIVLHIEVGSSLYFEGADFSSLNTEADIGDFLETENARSRKQAIELIRGFEESVGAKGVAHEYRVERTTYTNASALLVEQARISDVCIVPVHEDNPGDRDLAERIIFAAGRPALVTPVGARQVKNAEFNRIALAWDGSRQAARAMADAIPFLQRAAQVRIFTVEKEKELESFRTGVDLAKHLGRYGINANIDSVEKAHNQNIGQVFKSYVSQHNVDLLVMGAYGHSRFREFVLGGATRGILSDPPCWILMSHG
jgi:nucleotide-binding universal stress UspA family protein